MCARATATTARVAAAPTGRSAPSRRPLRRPSRIGLTTDVAGLNDGPAFLCTVASFQLPVSSEKRRSLDTLEANQKQQAFGLRVPVRRKLETGNWRLGT